MLDQALSLADSSWIYLIVCALVAVDAFLPLVPSETLLIAMAALAPTGRPHLAVLIAVTVAGALAGDGISYHLGRRLRPPRRPRIRAAHARARRALARRGATAIVTARFIPGGRTAITLAAGATGYPAGAFWAHAAVASIAWSVYITGLGFLGGTLFEDSPLMSIGAGVTLGLALGAAIEVTRSVRRRRRRRRARPAAGTRAEPQPAVCAEAR
ncbi:VTT domain-containing protein [Spirillospora sp. NPDC029432]|uniref:DedA family protein n=1 Tax=Spirillospora sp. NPDC029432 TaxID=3154599 RepID=UPI0034534A58